MKFQRFPNAPSDFNDSWGTKFRIQRDSVPPFAILCCPLPPSCCPYREIVDSNPAMGRLGCLDAWMRWIAWIPMCWLASSDWLGVTSG